MNLPLLNPSLTKDFGLERKEDPGLGLVSNVLKHSKNMQTPHNGDRN